MKQLWNVLITNGVTYECLADEEQGIQRGDIVIVQCERYLESGRVAARIGEPIPDLEEFERKRNAMHKGRHVEGQKNPVVLRKATQQDLKTIQENDKSANQLFAQAKQCILAHGLDMKLIHSHYGFDRKLVLFQFSAEGRVDFRELLRDMTNQFHCRVELRQIGVRDEAALMGGLGSCGRPFCCSQFLKTFNSINVKMAKQQGIALNPQNISGCCGRLKCCLYFEADQYKDVPLNRKKNANDAKADETPEKPGTPETAATDQKQPSRQPQQDRKRQQPPRNQQRPHENRQNGQPQRPPQRPQNNPNNQGGQHHPRVPGQARMARQQRIAAQGGNSGQPWQGGQPRPPRPPRQNNQRGQNPPRNGGNRPE